MEDTKTNKMLVSVVLDRSGSMESGRDGTISGYNEYIKGLRADKDHEYWVTLIQFDAHGAAYGPELTISYTDKPLSEVPDLTPETYAPRGGTPLYDAIGECVRRVDAKDRAITVVVITDGAENASSEFNLQSVKDLIKSKEAGGWGFVFIGCNIDSYATGGSLGISAMSTANYARGSETMMYANVAKSTMMRAHLTNTVGMHAASNTAFFDDQQRADMGDPSKTGGQTGTAPTFPVPAASIPSVVHKPAAKRRAWTVGS